MTNILPFQIFTQEDTHPQLWMKTAAHPSVEPDSTDPLQMCSWGSWDTQRTHASLPPGTAWDWADQGRNHHIKRRTLAHDHFCQSEEILEPVWYLMLSSWLVFSVHINATWMSLLLNASVIVICFTPCWSSRVLLHKHKTPVDLRDSNSYWTKRNAIILLYIQVSFKETWLLHFERKI